MDTNIRSEVVFAAIQRARASTDRNSPLRHEYTFIKIYNDESLTKYEKSYALIMIERDYDFCKVTQNKGEKRLCEHCSLESLATTYCENCIRIYLINNFPNWTSGNDNVDYLIQACQKEAARPDNIIEWIPYNKLQNIKYLAEGGISKIYSATWTDGRYDWNLETQQLIRIGELKVVLKKLENVENADRRWFDEAIIHLTLCNKNGELVICYGLTKDPKDGKYMIVMRRMNTDLRKYLRENRPSWKEKLIIANDIIKALCSIHGDGAIHRDLHPGNILYSKFNNHWYISDLGFCGPADKPLNGIYGNLPYIAPEVLTGGGYTSASDIYSFGMLMWEISSRQLPFINYEHDYYLMGEICKGERPKIITGIPSEYKELMQRCWDSDPLERPDANAISNEIEKMRDDSYKNDDTNELNTLEQEEQDNSSQTPGSSSKSTSSNSSKIYEPYKKPAVSTAEQEECLV